MSDIFGSDGSIKTDTSTPSTPTTTSGSAADQQAQTVLGGGSFDATKPPKLPSVKANPLIGVPTDQFGNPQTGWVSTRQWDYTNGVSPSMGLSTIQAGLDTRAARYRDGDEYQISTFDSGTIAGVQQAMRDAGLLSKYSKGSADPFTIAAFKKVLAYANNVGEDWQSAIATLGSMDDISKAAGSRRAPFTATLANPDDLKKVFQQAAYNLLGSNALSDDQLNGMIDAFHSQEIAAQRANYDKAMSGGSIEQTPSASAFAEQQIKEQNKSEVVAKGVGDYMTRLMQMMGVK